MGEDFRQSIQTRYRVLILKWHWRRAVIRTCLYHGYFTEDDEALLVEFTPPACDFEFTVSKLLAESLDYRYFSVHINKGTAQYRTSRRFRARRYQ